MTDPLEVARELVSRGVPVFACPPGSGPKGFQLPQAWQSIRPDERRLNVYRDGYALAAVMGHAYDVLDRDPRNGPGDLPFEWPEVFGVGLTPGGGEHYWIAASGLHKGPLAPGWDLQAGRADGSGRGFVFIPGTPGYAWVEPPRPVGPSPGRGGLASYRAARATEPRPAGAAGLPGGTVGEPIPAGAHSDTLFRFMSRLRSLGVPEDLARPLLDMRRADCQGRCSDPREHEWDQLGGRPYRAYEAGEPALRVAPEGFGVRINGPTAPAAEPTGPTLPQPVDWHEAFSAPPELEWSIPGIMPKGTGVVLYGPAGLGKSLITLEWAVRAARAGAIVAYVDHENDLRHEVVRRLREMGHGPGDLGNLRFYSFPEIPLLDGAAGAASLVAMVEGAEFVILDTISRMVGGGENDNDTWNAYYRNTGMALKSAGVGCLRLDHTGKDAERGQRGGSAKSGDVDIVWRLSGDGDIFSLKCEKNRMPIPEKVVTLRRIDGPLRHERVRAVEMDETMLKKRKVWDFLQDADVPVQEGRDAIKARLAKAKIEISVRALEEVIKVRKQLARHELEIPPAWLAQADQDGCLGFGGSPPVVWDE